MRGPRLSPTDSATPDGGPTREIIPFERSVLLAESDHRIANHLALVMSYVRLKTADLDAGSDIPSRHSVRAVLAGINAQIAAVAKLHRALVSEPPLGPVDLGANLRAVCAQFASGLTGTVRIVEDLAPGCLVSPEQVLALSQITAEIITNALKHASGGADAELQVRCREDAACNVLLEIIDSGAGFSAGFDPAIDGGLGFRLVRSLGEKLRARIVFQSTTKGVRFCLTLPGSDAALA